MDGTAGYMHGTAGYMVGWHSRIYAWHSRIYGGGLLDFSVTPVPIGLGF